MFKNLLLVSALLLICADALAQFEGRYSIVNRHSGLALDVTAFNTDDGANIHQWGYWGGQAQQFDINWLNNGFYSIRAGHSGKSMEVADWSNTAGGNIAQWTYWGADSQLWQIDHVEDGYFIIINKFSGMALDVLDFSTSEGGDIRQWPVTNAYNQQWSIQPVYLAEGASCVSTGSTSISSTVYVTSGTYDGGCRTFNPTSALGDGGQDEGQDPAFRVENGATLQNVIIGNNGVDGIHVYNGGTLNNITWTNVGEDAMTVKSSGVVVLNNVSAFDGSDKFLQVNAASSVFVSNCWVNNMGKFLRQNGGTDFMININVNNCNIDNMSEGIFRTDSSSSNARIGLSWLGDSGDTCIGSWNSCTSSDIFNY